MVFRNIEGSFCAHGCSWAFKIDFIKCSASVINVIHDNVAYNQNALQGAPCMCGNHVSYDDCHQYSCDIFHCVCLCPRLSRHGSFYILYAPKTWSQFCMRGY
ncbi:hypothetical protein MRX96_054365 [Rhipicephalus microplus]